MPTTNPTKSDNEKIYIEIKDAYGSEETGIGDHVLDISGQILERTKASIIHVAESMVGAIRSVDQAITPDEFKLKFAIKFRADGKVLIASSSAEGALEIEMVYKHSVKKDA